MAVSDGDSPRPPQVCLGWLEEEQCLRHGKMNEEKNRVSLDIGILGVKYPVNAYLIQRKRTDPATKYHMITFANNLICVGVCDVASLYPYSHRTLCSSLLAQQFHLQEACRAGPHPPEDGAKIPSTPWDETRRGIKIIFSISNVNVCQHCYSR